MPKWALLSVYDKTGVAELGRGLVDLGYEVISTGGTLASLEAAGLPVTAVSDVTAFPEILDGRVKTLHPRIHGGPLARRDDPAHLSALEAHRISPIDVVAANLYPFAETVARPGVDLADALEQIDIGGPAMIRAAAKNFPGVVVLTDPADYTSAGWSAGWDAVGRAKASPGGEGVCPHGGLRRGGSGVLARPPGVASGSCLQAGWRGLCATVRTHNNEPRPTGLRAGEPGAGVLEAEQLAARSCRSTISSTPTPPGTPWAGLPNRPWPSSSTPFLAGLPSEVTWQRRSTRPCAAIRFRPSAASSHSIARLTARQPNAWPKSSSRLWLRRDSTTRHSRYWGSESPCAYCACPHPRHRLDGTETSWDVRPIAGGLLVQTADCAAADPALWRVVTAREPNTQEMDDLAFAWHAVRHVKSNAIVLARDGALTGVGSGQPNRLESVRIAVAKAGDRASGSVLASDAFSRFPMA